MLSFGELKTPGNTVSCVKGADYPLAEFLFGFSNPNDKKMSSFIKSVQRRGNKLCFCVIYLAPQDYHRFHSPAHVRFSQRRHIAGYLESVNPRYMNFRRNVLKNNERVNMLGVWKEGFFALSFIGAMNVGSVVVNFDEQLRTNQRDPLPPYFADFNYRQLSKQENKKSREKTCRSMQNKYDTKVEEETDIIFKSFDVTSNKIEADTKEKHESTTDHGYKICSKGVELAKGEEIGFFKMGSTVAIVFECPPDIEMRRQVGEKVYLGERLYD